MKNKLHYSLKLFVLALGLIIFNQVKAQYALDWVNEFTSKNSAYTDLYAIDNDAQNNYYVMGYYSDSLNVNFSTNAFDLACSNGVSYFIAKYTSNGNLVWVREIAGDINQAWLSGYSLKVDAAGNVFILGTVLATVANAQIDVNPDAGVNLIPATPPTGITRESFLMKLNSSGNFQWVNSIPNDGSGYYAKLEIDNSGNVYVADRYDGFLNFGSLTPISFNSSGQNVYVAKFTNSGSFVWARQLQRIQSGSILNTTIKVENSNLYLGGYYTGIVDLNPGTGIDTIANSLFRIGYIVKLDTAGNFLYANRILGTSDNNLYSIDTDNAGNLYASGYFSETADLDPGTAVNNFTSNGGRDIFVLKLNQNGAFQWAKQIGGDNADESYDLLINQTGNVVLTGYYTGTVDFDPGAGMASQTSQGGGDCFLLLLDANGNYDTSYVWGGNGFDAVFNLIKDNANSLVLSGVNGSSNMDYDNFNRGGGGEVPFLMKLATPSGNTSVNEEENLMFVLYPNPAATQFTIANAEIGTRINIIDMAGKLIQAETVSTTNHTVYIYGLANGMYIIQLENNGQISQKKLVINK